MKRPESYEDYLRRIINANGGDENLPMVTVTVRGRCNKCGYQRGYTDSAATEDNAFVIISGRMVREHIYCQSTLNFETIEVVETTPAEARKRRIQK